MARIAFVTGPTGQDGSYLVELLLGKGYEVHALDRSRSQPAAPNLAAVAGHPRFHVHSGDMLEHERLSSLVRDLQPDEVYNLAAQSFVPASWEAPVTATMVNAVGPVVLLEAIRRHASHARFYQATSSEAFGLVEDAQQDESTYHHPRSPYGCTKSFGMNITRNYRESFGLFACNGILFNHESERRGPQFVTRKVTQAAARLATQGGPPLRVGNLDAHRDWGHAEDYVRAMWMILQHHRPDDYVVASGASRSVREFVEAAFAAAGLPIAWQGSGMKEHATDAAGRVLVEVDPALHRPAEVERLQGDASKVRRELGWEPAISFEQLVRRMVEHDLAASGAPALRPLAA